MNDMPGTTWMTTDLRPQTGTKEFIFETCAMCITSDEVLGCVRWGQIAAWKMSSRGTWETEMVPCWSSSNLYPSVEWKDAVALAKV